MPAVGKITLDTSNYDRGLQKVSSEMSKTGSVISGAASAAGANVGKLGQQFGLLGNTIGAVASGPIGMLVAAFGVLVSVGVSVWDKLTLSAEEYATKMERAVGRQSAVVGRLKAEQSKDDGYLKRLRELSKEEKLSYEQKREAQALIAHLKDRYGDLGISLDMVKGKLQVGDGAEGLMLTNQDIALKGALRAQMGLQGKQTANLAKSVGADKVFSSMGLKEQLEFARGQYSAQTTQGGLDKWGKLIDSLEKQMELKRQIDDPARNFEMLRRTSDATKTEKKPETAPAPEVDKFGKQLGKDFADLYGDAMKANGQEKQAEREALFRRYEELKGSPLSIEEAGKLGQLANLQWKLKDAQQTETPKPQEMEQVRTNALTARGGFASAIRDRSQDRAQENIKDNTKKTAEILKEIRSVMDDLGRAE